MGPFAAFKGNGGDEEVGKEDEDIGECEEDDEEDEEGEEEDVEERPQRRAGPLAPEWQPT